MLTSTGTAGSLSARRKRTRASRSASAAKVPPGQGGEEAALAPPAGALQVQIGQGGNRASRERRRGRPKRGNGATPEARGEVGAEVEQAVTVDSVFMCQTVPEAAPI